MPCAVAALETIGTLEVALAVAVLWVLGARYDISHTAAALGYSSLGVMH